MDCITSKYAMILVVCGVLMYFKSRVKQTLQGVNFSHYLAVFRGKSPSPAKGNNDYAPLHDLENPSPSPAPVHAPEPEPALDSKGGYYADALKKSRFVWSVELHHKFVEIVNQLGLEKAVPTKILEMMNERNLTREQVASHLQKYRLYMKKQLASKDLWPEESHLKFVDAVNQLGLDNATPEKILELMNVENITRENVASHLEKYSLYMKRIRVLVTDYEPIHDVENPTMNDKDDPSVAAAALDNSLMSDSPNDKDDPSAAALGSSPISDAPDYPYVALRKRTIFWNVELHYKFVQIVDQLGIDQASPEKILEMMNAKNLTKERVASHLEKYMIYRKIQSALKDSWSEELHLKFVEAVNQLGVRNAVPERILELMNVKDLTRENVATHLHKYRMHYYLGRSPPFANSANMVESLGDQHYSPVNAYNQPRFDGPYYSPIDEHPSTHNKQGIAGPMNGDPSAWGKPRLVWSVELHHKFVEAVNHLGLDQASPEGILELMNVDSLTRDKVASHLEKYRLYLKTQLARKGGVASEVC